MKWIISIFLFLSFIKHSIGQITDSAKLKITYKLMYLPDSTRPDKYKTDVLNLLIGDSESVFYSYANFQADSMFKSDIGNNAEAIKELIKNRELQKKYNRPGLYSYYKIYYNYPKNKLTITDEIMRSKYIYSENIEKIDWTILPDTLTILKYHCQKAWATFRGRKYEAWFTLEIPVSMGPYKFYGLPGLIIKISDLKSNYIFECIGVEKLKSALPIMVQSKEYSQTTRSEFRKAFQVFFQNPWESLSNGTNTTIGGRDAGQIKSMLQRGIPYNPIELE